MVWACQGCKMNELPTNGVVEVRNLENVAVVVRPDPLWRAVGKVVLSRLSTLFPPDPKDISIEQKRERAFGSNYWVPPV